MERPSSPEHFSTWLERSSARSSWEWDPVISTSSLTMWLRSISGTMSGSFTPFALDPQHVLVIVHITASSSEWPVPPWRGTYEAGWHPFVRDWTASLVCFLFLFVLQPGGSLCHLVPPKAKRWGSSVHVGVMPSSVLSYPPVVLAGPPWDAFWGKWFPSGFARLGDGQFGLARLWLERQGFPSLSLQSPA